MMAGDRNSRRELAVPESFALRPISTAAVPEAIRKAEHYRLLNDPEQAESICLDVLDVDPGNQQALVVAILAITDQFGSGQRSISDVPASEYVARLTSEYQRSYYTGIVCERQARAHLRRAPSKSFAYDAFRDAMEWYEKAASIRPNDNDEAVLRWNACVRTIRRANLRPPPVEPELPLE
jgi:hypothetical protein